MGIYIISLGVYWGLFPKFNNSVLYKRGRLNGRYSARSNLWQNHENHAQKRTGKLKTRATHQVMNTRCVTCLAFLLSADQQALGARGRARAQDHWREKHERAKHYHHHPMIIRNISHNASGNNAPSFLDIKQLPKNSNDARIIRSAVLAVGMLRGLNAGQLEGFGLMKFLQYLKCKGVSGNNCTDTAATPSPPSLWSFGVFEGAQGDACTGDLLRTAESLFAAHGPALIRLVTDAEQRSACLPADFEIPADLDRPWYWGGARSKCSGYYLQFMKVQLAFEALEAAEQREGFIFDVVVKVRTDFIWFFPLNFPLDRDLPSLLSSQRGEKGGSDAFLQHDMVWLARRGAAAWLATAWARMVALGVLNPDMGAAPQREALASLDWAGLAESCRALTAERRSSGGKTVTSHCWALRSNFWLCSPRLVAWPRGQKLPQLDALPAAPSEWPVSNDSRWQIDKGCTFRFRDQPGSFNKEAEVALGLALYITTTTPTTPTYDNITAGYQGHGVLRWNARSVHRFTKNDGASGGESPGRSESDGTKRQHHHHHHRPPLQLEGVKLGKVDRRNKTKKRQQQHHQQKCPSPPIMNGGRTPSHDA